MRIQKCKNNSLTSQNRRCLLACPKTGHQRGRTQRANGKKIVVELPLGPGKGSYLSRVEG